MRRYPHDHDRLWRPGRTVHSPGSQSTARGSMCHHCRWCAVVGQWQHQEQARDGSSYSLKLLAPFKRHSYHDRCNIIRPTVLVCPFHQVIHTLLWPKSLYNLLQLFIAHKIRGPSVQSTSKSPSCTASENRSTSTSAFSPKHR